MRDCFREQADACESLGSPFTAHLLRLLADHLALGNPVADHILHWPGDPSYRKDSVALRLVGGLHALTLNHADPDLQALYANPHHFSDAQMIATLLAAIARHPEPLLHWLSSAPQTNEVRRSAALIAAGHWLTARFGLPLALSELGASAGLNLNWDRYALAIGPGYGPADSPVRLTPEWRGSVPPVAPPQVVERRAVDLNPLDVTRDAVRIRSYIWADQAHRLALTQAAIALATDIHVEQGDAVDWLEARLNDVMPGRLHLIYHTIAWQYFPKATQLRGEALLQAAGKLASVDAPLAHLAMEADGAEPGAALTLRLGRGVR
ncbi:DUF2332 domain-containing protein [Pseudorhodobacter sp.]|uniref:DUF2332 domain-containing protein n=1 Tax=Pseudorhodobacter sp. TaxID=1934400 RepID=UPI003463FE92